MAEAIHDEPRVFRRFLREQVARYWGLQLEIGLCLLAQVVLELIDPLILRALIDRALGDGDLPLLAGLVVLLAVSLLFRTGFRVVSTWLYAHGGLRILFDFRRRAYERVQGLSPYSLQGERFGDVLARLTADVDVLQRAAVNTVVNAFHDVLVILGIGAVLVFLDPYLALVLAVVYPALAALFVVLNRHVRRESHGARDAVGGLYDFLEERVGGTRLVQEFRRERQQARAFVRTSRPWMRSNLRLSIFSSLQVSLADVIASIAPITVFVFGGARALDGSLSLGTLVAFYTLAARLQRPMMGLVDINLDLQMARAALARVYELIDREPEIRELPGAAPRERADGGLELDQVDFAWGSDVILRGISARIEPGHTVGIVGPSGSGKSTLAALLTRYLDPTRGTVRLDGVDLRHWRLADLRRFVRLVPQEARLFHDTLRENLRLAAPRASDAELRAALDAVALGSFVDGLDEGLGTTVGRDGLRLSGGERQRVALARALLSRPRVLVLDEATAALDAHTERAVLDLLRGRAWRDVTLVMVAHRLATVRDADAILVIEDGRLAEAGTHEELLARRGTYRALHDEQAGQG